MRVLPIPLLLLVSAPVLLAQAETREVARLLEPALHSPYAVAFQLRQYLIARTPGLPQASARWPETARQLRERVLREIVFHGWPSEWIQARARFEDAGLLPGGQGYRMRKLRYEIVPGFWSTAILYEPDPLRERVPAVLNVNGHVGAPGKAVEYKQKRCIQQARHGVLALNLEWIGMGELVHKENAHWFGAHLDLVGANAVGLFYLAMRRGLDFLWDHPAVDRERIAMTGLSGGGWQTIVLSALDERVRLAAPVAGYAAAVSRIERPADIGDIEQNATDLLTLADYSTLTALRAPRPTLLIYNAEDDCCFRAPLVKPYIYDAVRPFFEATGAAAAFAWHENTDPSTHNYQLDNRRQFYRFLNTHFGTSLPLDEGELARELRSFEELAVGVPEDNLTILGLARKLAKGLQQPQRPAPEARAALARVLRYQPTGVRHAWAISNTKNKGLETRRYRFDFQNGLSATGLWIEAIAAPAGAPATIVLDDNGKKAAAALVADRVNRGERVLAADLLFFGDAAPEKPASYAWTQLIATLGERSLGVQVAQLMALAAWLDPPAPVRVEACGMRSQVIALAAAALEPSRFREVRVRNGIASLRHLLDAPVEYRAAPELFCLDLYREFDIASLEALGPKPR
ncbi:MAG: acetylxylan esterase [Bryobacteraceae bacterium]